MSADNDESKELSRVDSERAEVMSDGLSFRRSASPDDEDIEIVNYQDYLSLNVNLYDFSQVIFLEVKETYVPGENVECRYKVTNALYPNVRDRVCLFRLGWISPQDYKTYMWAKSPEDYEAGTVFDSQITFSGEKKLSDTKTFGNFQITLTEENIEFILHQFQFRFYNFI